MRNTLFLLGILAAFATPAEADDLYPPAWRGSPGTTWQAWEFGTPDFAGVLPDYGDAVGHDGNSYGGPLPSTEIVYIAPFGTGEWLPDVEGQQGVWPLSGFIEVNVDNWPEPNPKKLMYVQLTWMAQGVDPGMADEPYITDIDPPPIWAPTEIQREPIRDSLFWFHSIFAWELDHNPADEFLTITGDIFVSELVIDTWCVPEPATAGLLMLGVAGLLLRRRDR